MSDGEDLEKSLRDIKMDVPAGRPNLPDSELQRICKRWGKSTVKSIQKAAKELPKNRIYHVFSSVDSQDVADILVNDFSSIK